MMLIISIKRDGPILLALAAVAAVSGCGPNERILRSASEKPENIASAPAETTLETDIETMRTAKFSHIYVIRRKDGQALNKEDIGIIRNHSANTNRRVLSDNGRAIVIGTNAAIPLPEVAILNDRFGIDTFVEEPAEDTNRNT